uniref:Protein tyrosine phosphatase receptor type E n=1 Tax=Pipistrellus kuhlii TaxID=59472 RepID=A0A7J7VCD7_PIPKU|nr:protein tyrosine phosphatase receptor type E [Pipistrellus kuhlii]
MEPFCPLLLAGFSLRLARAFTVNESTPADSNWTSTTAEPQAPGARPLLAWLLLPLLLLLLLLLLAGYFLRFRKHRKATVSGGDRKMPNGILEEQAAGDASQPVPVGAHEVLPHPGGPPGGGDPGPLGRRRQDVPRGVPLAAVRTHARNLRAGQ